MNLAIPGSKRHPSRGRPPGDNEAEEPAKPGTSTLSCPDVDRAAQRKSRADLGEDSGGNEHEDHGDDVRRPAMI